MQQHYIIIVDDDEDDRFLIESAFQDTMLQTRLQFFDNGDSLLSFMQSCPSVLPSVILMDINMPGRSGIETLQILKTASPMKNVPIIIFSTTKSAHEINEVYNSGANSFITKPSSYEGLKALVHKIHSYWVETNLTQ
jgi:CheY-like chemotaxis protein